MKEWLLNLALPLIIGPLASFVFEKLQDGVKWIENLTGQTKVIVVGAFSILLPFVAKAIPGFPTTLDGIDLTAITSLVTLVLTQITHKAMNQPAKS